MIPLPQILRTARAGSPARAWGMFVDGGWLDVTDDPKALTLKGRLIKDQAKAASGDERLRLFREAGQAYEQASAARPASYPLINAATLALMGGDAERSKSLAGDVLKILDESPLEAETPYWLAATRSEAHMLLGQVAEAQTALKDAVFKAPQAWEDHAATIGQFRMLGDKLGADVGWLEAHRPPASLHFQGAMGIAHDDSKLRADVDAWLAAENIGFGYGALAAGADIIIAEALLARGAELHVVLPCARDIFRAQSVEPYGEDWATRFDRSLDAAVTMTANNTAQGPVKLAVEMSEATCVGMAFRNARNLQSAAHILRIGRDLDRSKARVALWSKVADQIHILTAEGDNADRASTSQPAGRRQVYLAVRNADALKDSDLNGLLSREKNASYTSFSFQNSEDAWAAYALIKANATKAVPVAICQGFVDTPNEERWMGFRMDGLAFNASDDKMLADRDTAFGLLAADPEVRIEECGEIRTVYETFPVYAIISSS